MTKNTLKRGLIKIIGFSNFLEHHLEKIIDEPGVTPATNQIEIQPYFHNKENVAANQKFGIASEAWSPLGRDSSHQKDNLAIFDFELSDDEMKIVFALDKGEEGRVEGQHPDEYHEYV